MVRKLCIRSLRRGRGSVDFIHTLLIMEDDLDEDAEVSPSPMAQQTSLEGSEPETWPILCASNALVQVWGLSGDATGN